MALWVGGPCPPFRAPVLDAQRQTLREPHQLEILKGSRLLQTYISQIARYGSEPQRAVGGDKTIFSSALVMVPISVISLEDAAIYCICIDQFPSGCADSKSSALPCRYPAHMSSSVFPSRHLSHNNIASLEPFHLLRRLLVLHDDDAAAVDLPTKPGAPAHRLGVQAAASG